MWVSVCMHLCVCLYVHVFVMSVHVRTYVCVTSRPLTRWQSGRTSGSQPSGHVVVLVRETGSEWRGWPQWGVWPLSPEGLEEGCLAGDSGKGMSACVGGCAR